MEKASLFSGVSHQASASCLLCQSAAGVHVLPKLNLTPHNNIKLTKTLVRIRLNQKAFI